MENTTQREPAGLPAYFNIPDDQVRTLIYSKEEGHLGLACTVCEIICPDSSWSTFFTTHKDLRRSR